jgi:hypothetical protein
LRASSTIVEAIFAHRGTELVGLGDEIRVKSTPGLVGLDHAHQVGSRRSTSRQ